jgi:hypothetical protein
MTAEEFEAMDPRFKALHHTGERSISNYIGRRWCVSSVTLVEVREEHSFDCFGEPGIVRMVATRAGKLRVQYKERGAGARGWITLLPDSNFEHHTAAALVAEIVESGSRPLGL